MANAILILPSDAANTGKDLQAFSNTVGANTVYSEAVTPVNSSGTEEGTATVPIRIDPTGTTAQPVTISSLPSLASGSNTIGKVDLLGNAGATLDAAPGAAVPTNALMVGGSDGTDLRAIATDSSGNLQDNLKLWGGTAVTAPPASGVPAVGTEVAPVMKPMFHKTTQILTTTNLGPSASYSSSWFDTNGSGDVFLTISYYMADGGGSYAAQSIEVYESDDTTNANLKNHCGHWMGPTYGLYVECPIRCRYWMVIFTSISGHTSTSFELTATTSNVPCALPMQGITVSGYPLNALVTNNGYVVTAPNNGGYTQDGGTWYSRAQQASDASVSAPAVTPCYQLDALGNSMTAARNPNIFKGSFLQSGIGTIWQPTAAKKFRLMKYKLSMGEDCTYSTSITPVMLGFRRGLKTTTNDIIAVMPTFIHRVVVPTAVLATSGILWDSKWVDLDNGWISDVATVPLQLGINIAQSTSAITPTFAIASNQWEAATMGFKTTAGVGGIRLRQQINGVSAAVSIALTAISVNAGNAIIVAVRTTNSSGGAPTIAVTDTQGNTYTALAITTNASDGTYGSSLQLFYTLNMAAGNAANVITATTTVHTATEVQAIAMEYEGIAAIGGASQSATTGNSTGPSSGSYTPGEAGDLIITAFATMASLGSQPTISGYSLVGTIFTAAGAICVADNFGNGSLATGVVEVMTAGTEE